MDVPVDVPVDGAGLDERTYSTFKLSHGVEDLSEPKTAVVFVLQMERP